MTVFFDNRIDNNSFQELDGFNLKKIIVLTGLGVGAVVALKEYRGSLEALTKKALDVLASEHYQSKYLSSLPFAVFIPPSTGLVDKVCRANVLFDSVFKGVKCGIGAFAISSFLGFFQGSQYQVR